MFLGEALHQRAIGFCVRHGRHAEERLRLALRPQSQRLDGEQIVILVQGEGIDPPTNGLQNRCSTAELARQTALS